MMRQILEKFSEHIFKLQRLLFITDKHSIPYTERKYVTPFKTSEYPTSLFRVILRDTKCKAKAEGALTQNFQVRRKVKRGEYIVLSTLLFNIRLARIVRQLPINTSGIIMNRRSQCIVYADDILLFKR